MAIMAMGPVGLRVVDCGVKRGTTRLPGRDPKDQESTEEGRREQMQADGCGRASAGNLDWSRFWILRFLASLDTRRPSPTAQTSRPLPGIRRA